ncbi:MAG: TlpA disulfide reductase family protein [Longimicrobiales bacterium]|nr:TlpA disulfide reductase family protein [Longimicrobiales bacterium]
MLRSRLASSAATAAALALAACAPAEQAIPTVGAPAPAYGARTLGGDSVSLAGLRGQVVLLNFWATWCAPCRHETPFLQALYQERKSRGLEIVGASMDTGDARGQVADFVEEYGVTYPILLDPQMRGMDLYRVLGLPATFLVDREGILRWMRIGPVGETDRDFLNALEAVLG